MVIVPSIPPRSADLTPFGYRHWLDGFVLDFKLGAINALYGGPVAWSRFWDELDHVEGVGLAVLVSRGELEDFIKWLEARKGRVSNASFIKDGRGANQGRGRRVNNAGKDRRA